MASLAGDATFVPITPCRAVDTRQSLFGSPIAAGEDPAFSVRGDSLGLQGGALDGCGIPDDAVAVEGTATAIDADGNGWLRVWDFGSPEPTATFLNYAGGRNISNTGTFPILTPGDGGPDLQAKNYGATAHFTFDVNGYFVTGQEGSFTPVEPCRILDTRSTADPSFGDRFSPDEELLIRVRDPIAEPSVAPLELVNQGGSDFACGIPEAATSVELAVTAVDPDGSGFVRMWPFDPTENYPNSGTMVNYTSGSPLTNTGTVQIDPGFAFELVIRNLGGTTDVVVDVFGYHAGPGSGDSYSSLNPCRVVDTRNARVWASADDSFDPVFEPTPLSDRLADGDSYQVQISGDDSLIPPPGLGSGELSVFESQGGALGGCGVPGDASAVEVSITWTQPAGRGFLRVFPANFVNPKSTFINYAGGRSVTNTGTIQLPNDGDPLDWIASNFGGEGFLIMDVQGYFRASG